MSAKMLLRGCLVVACVSWTSLPSVVHAQDEQPSVPSNFVTFGGAWWDQTAPEAKFQEFRDLPKGGFVDKWLLTGEKGRRSWEFSGMNALRADEAATFMYSNGIRYELRANYVQTPHNISLITRSPYDLVNQGDGVYDFTLPDSFQMSNQTLLSTSGSATANAYNARIADLLRSSPLVKMGFRTDAAGAKINVRPAKGWQLDVTGTKRDRSGTKPWSASFGFSGAMEIWEPINQRTMDGNVGITYMHKNVMVRADGGISAFTNYSSTLQWDNPRRLTSTAAGTNAGSGFGQMDLYPNNKALRGNLTLGVNLPNQTTVTATAGRTRMTQDEPFLPFTVNQAVIDTAAKYPATPLAFLDGATSLDGKADATKLTGRVTTNGIEKVSATYRMDYYKYDNKTPIHEYGASVAYDQSYQKGPFETDPFGNSLTVVGLDLDYGPVDQLGLGATVEHRAREHTFREVEKDGELVLTGNAVLRPAKGVRLTGSYLLGDRKPSDRFLVEDYQDTLGNYTEQANLRRFDVGQRQQMKIKGGLAWMPNEMVDLSANYDHLKNDYVHDSLSVENDFVTGRGPQMGLRLQKGDNVIGVATLHATSTFDVSAGYGWGKMESDMFSRETPTAPPPLRTDDSLTWSIHTTDRNTFIFSSAEWWPVVQKVSFTVNYEYDASRTTYDMTKAFERVNNVLVPWTGGDVPTITYRRHDVQLQLLLRALRDTDIGFRYGRQSFKVKDFSADNIPVVDASSDQSVASTGIYLGDRYLNYRANTAAVVITRRF